MIVLMIRYDITQTIIRSVPPSLPAIPTSPHYHFLIQF